MIPLESPDSDAARITHLIRHRRRGRVEWFHQNPLIVMRPASFTGTGTGASQVEWFHWNHLTVMRPASFTGTGTAVSQVE